MDPISESAAFGSPAALIPAPRPAELHLARLAEFLGDESPVVWREVQRHFEQAGPAARRILLQATKNTDARTRMRARHLLAQLERSAAWRRLVRYCTRSKIELEPALFLLSEWMDPDFDALSARNELDRLGARVSAQIEVRTDDLRRAGSLCDVLGREERYGGSIGEFDHPDNVLLHRALQKKAGMPLTLCALYRFVAQRAGFTISMLPIPGHIMLRVPMNGRTLIADPYDRGRLRSERDTRAQLARAGLKLQNAWFQEASDRYLFRRQLLNLCRGLDSVGRSAQSRQASLLIDLLDRSHSRR